jgi:hypothetical protein
MIIQNLMVRLLDCHAEPVEAVMLSLSKHPSPNHLRQAQADTLP